MGTWRIPCVPDKVLASTVYELTLGSQDQSGSIIPASRVIPFGLVA